jgi:hypothetical protein
MGIIPNHVIPNHIIQNWYYTKSLYTKSLYTKSLYTKSLYTKSLYTKQGSAPMIGWNKIDTICILWHFDNWQFGNQHQNIELYIEPVVCRRNVFSDNIFSYVLCILYVKWKMCFVFVRFWIIILCTLWTEKFETVF